MCLALKRKLDGVSRQLFANVLRRVFGRTWSRLVIRDVAILVYKLHLAATKAETCAFVLFHIVHEKVISGSVGIRGRISVLRPHYTVEEVNRVRQTTQCHIKLKVFKCQGNCSRE